MNNIKMVGITEPIVPGIETAEEFIAYCARVSNPINQLNTGTVGKLLKYMVDHQHWSPFEMVSIIMEIKTTRDIGRQILRHRSFSFQEFSQRYASPKAEDFITNREARLQDTKNRQNSIETNDAELQETWKAIQEKTIFEAVSSYNWAIKRGIAKEVAPTVLPEGLTPTHMYMAGTLRSWIHYCQLRMDNGTQKEHQEIAKKCWDIICKEIPSLTDILSINPTKEG